MKTLIAIALLVLPVVVFGKPSAERRTELPDPPIEGASWKQTFADEFGGSAIREKNWVVRHNNRACRKNNFWHRECARLDGEGRLRMIIRKSSGKPGWHDTSCVETKGRFQQRYGYFEMRAQMQTQEGFWSAFWAMPAAPHKIGGIEHGGMDGSEIDIFEKNTLADSIVHNLHWNGYGEHHKSDGKRSTIAGVTNGFHTFSLLWTPDEYIFYVDGKQTWQTTAGGVSQVPVYLLISSETGDWGGDITKASLPDEWLVDYVRAWQLYKPDGSEAFSPKPLAGDDPMDANSATR